MYSSQPYFNQLSNYIGIPYRRPASNDEGLNCWELVEKVMREVFNIEPPAITFKDNEEFAAPVFMLELKRWQKIKRGHVKGGDMVHLLMKGMPIHCGIMIDNVQMLHTLENRNACIESLESIAWKNRILGFYRWAK